MKKIILLLIIFVSVSSFSQNADERIGTILNQANWFELERNYSELKDSMQVNFLKLMSESMIGYYFNRPNEALESINKLIANHQSEIGGQNALNMAILSCHIEGLKGNYNTETQNTLSIINQLKQQGAGKETYEGLENMYYFYNKLKDIPSPSVTRPQEDVVVPIDIEKVVLPTSFEPKGWRGTTILIPVTIKEKNYRFIFDTGAGTSAMSEHMAKETGVRILNDSLMVNLGLPGAKTGRMGVLDNMKIGNMDFHNSLISILPPNTLDSIIKVDAILGMDFIGLFDEICIYPKKNKIVFPNIASNPPSYGRNLIKIDRTLKLNGEAYDKELMLHFDTGCSTAGLNYLYYKDHKSALEFSGKREIITGGGFNHINTREVLRIPSFEMRIGDKQVFLKNLIVDTKNYGIEPANDMGIIGMDMINSFDCVIINLKDMFLKLE